MGRPLTVELSRSDAKIGVLVSAIVAWSSWAVTVKAWRDELAASLSSGVVLLASLAVLGRKGFLARTASVGSDAVVLRGAGHDVVVPLSRVHRVEYGPRGVVLRLERGDDIPIRTLSLVFPTQAERDRRDLVLSRVRRELFALRERGGAGRSAAPGSAEVGSAADALPASAELLARAGQSAEAWKRACLAAVTEATAGYRRSSLTVLEALEILESPAAPIEIRAGAALALSPWREASVRARVRAAIDATAIPVAALTLERAASGHIEERSLKRSQRIERKWEREQARPS